MKNSGMSLLIAVLSGTVLGVAVKRSVKSTREDTAPPARVRAERPTPAAIPKPFEVSIEDLISPGRADRYVLLAGWLPQATSTDLQRLWDAWKDLTSMAAFRRLLLARWVEVDLMASRAAAGNDMAFWEAWISQDPEAAFSDAWNSGDDLLIRRATRLLIARDPDLARKLITSKGGKVSEADLAPGFLAAGRYREAMDAVAGVVSSTVTSRHSIFEEWIKEDPEGALDWAASNQFSTASDGINNEKLMLELIRPHADKAGSLAARLPTGAFRQRLESGLVTALAERDPQAALGFARTLSSPQARRRGLAAVGMGLAKSDPDAALQVYSELVADGARPGHEHAPVLYRDNVGCCPRDNPFDPFVDSLMEGLPDRALDTAMAMDSGSAGDEAVEDLAKRWMSHDLWEFSKWLATQPQNTRRDGLAGQLVDRMLSESHPNYQQAAQWIGSIRDTNLAADHVGRLVHGWRETDPAGFETYLKSGTAAKIIVEAGNPPH